MLSLAFLSLENVGKSEECYLLEKLLTIDTSFLSYIKRAQIEDAKLVHLSQSRSQFLFCLPLAGKSPLLLCQPYDEREGQNSVVFQKSIASKIYQIHVNIFFFHFTLTYILHLNAINEINVNIGIMESDRHTTISTFLLAWEFHTCCVHEVVLWISMDRTKQAFITKNLITLTIRRLKQVKFTITSSASQ